MRTFRGEAEGEGSCFLFFSALAVAFRDEAGPTHAIRRPSRNIARWQWCPMSDASVESSASSCPRPRMPSRDIWTVIRAGNFYGTHDDFDAAFHAGHKLAADAVVRCWQSDGQLLIPARRPVGQ